MKKWSEDRIEKEMEYLMEDIPERSEQLKQEEQLEKKIEMRIKRRVQKIIYRTICGIVLCVLFLLIVIHPLLNAAFLNPKKLNGDGYGVMYQTLRDYFEVTRPYAELCSLNVESKGFARYELQMQFTDRRGPVNLGISNTWVDLEFGKYKEWKDVDLYTSALMNRFSNDFEDSEQFIEQVKELPSSAVLYLSVGETNPRPVEELMGENVEIIWAEINQPNVEFQGGIAFRKEFRRLAADGIHRAGGRQSLLMNAPAAVAVRFHGGHHSLRHAGRLRAGGGGVIQIDHGLMTFPAPASFSTMEYILVTEPTASFSVRP